MWRHNVIMFKVCLPSPKFLTSLQGWRKPYKQSIPEFPKLFDRIPLSSEPLSELLIKSDLLSLPKLLFTVYCQSWSATIHQAYSATNYVWKTLIWPNSFIWLIGKSQSGKASHLTTGTYPVSALGRQFICPYLSVQSLCFSQDLKIPLTFFLRSTFKRSLKVTIIYLLLNTFHFTKYHSGNIFWVNKFCFFSSIYFIS